MVGAAHSARLRIGIVGLGPRGLSALERLLKLAETDPATPVDIVVFEPGEPGCGLHILDQPDYLLLNTIASELTMFPDALSLPDAAGSELRAGPNFYDWCAERGHRVADSGHVVAVGGRPVRPTDFLPRRLLGAYLCGVFAQIVRHAPVHARVVVHRETVATVEHHASSNGKARTFVLRGRHAQAEVDRLVLAVGHPGALPEGQPGEIGVVYPMPGRFSSIAAGQRIAIEGFGLVAMDALAALTEGRGGRFVRGADGQQTTYVPSGKEPRVAMYSRDGMPFRARPDSNPGRVRHRALLLTASRVEALRSAGGGAGFDFDAQIFPLLLLEMQVAYYRACAASSESLSSWSDKLLAAARDPSTDEAAVRHLIGAMAERYGGFDPSAFLPTRLPDHVDAASYQRWMRHQLAEDLVESRKGVPASPLKTALEIWRDLRPELRAVVDFGGLSSQSHQVFYTRVAALVNRLVAGPQKERHQDLIALLDSGIVTFVHPTVASAARDRGTALGEWTIRARVPSSGLLNTASGPIAALREMGVLRPVAGAAGLDGIQVNAACQPVDAAGRVEEAIWILGSMTEGSSYYNHYIPSPGGVSRAFTDAHNVARACLTRARLAPAHHLRSNHG